MEYMGCLSVGDLFSVCNLLGIDHEGTKEQIRKKIVTGLMDINSLIPVPDDEHSEEEEEVADDPNRQEHPINDDQGGDRGSILEDGSGIGLQDDGTSSQFNDDGTNWPDHMTGRGSYKEVEKSIRLFSGDDDFPIERWVSDFEEAVMLFEWDDLRILIFGKKSLKGLAKTFIQGEKSIASWTQLRKSLEEEFSSKITSATLHKMLYERKMKKGEGVREYSLNMRELSSRGSIDEEALIEYIISGIQDNSAYKTVLYGTRTCSEFKDRLKVFDKMKKSIEDDNKLQKPSRDIVAERVQTIVTGAIIVVTSVSRVS